jgi:hypothetical protein
MNGNNTPEHLPQGMTVTIPTYVLIVTRKTFSKPAAVEVINFAPGALITRFPPGTFAICRCLKCICIPRSVEIISGHCFASPAREGRLERVTFEAGSKLREIAPDVRD